ncbi:MAG: protein kinase domain-containing protein [Phycisphaerales bacterium]
MSLPADGNHDRYADRNPRLPARDLTSATGSDDADASSSASSSAERPLIDRARKSLRRKRSADAAAGGATAGRGGGLLAEAPPLLPGFEIIRPIRRGGQGVVYLGIETATRREVAVKVISADGAASPTQLARFQQEVEVLSRLEHPNIVAIRASGNINGQSYYVMDYIDGLPLDAHVKVNGNGHANNRGQNGHRNGNGLSNSSIDVDRSLQLFLRICDGVHAAHLCGVIHRDLKPDNILVDRNGHPHIVDFGLAKLWGDEMASQRNITQTGHWVGTLHWMSPEQVRGGNHAIDLRTDVYSLGVILHHMLTGDFPYVTTGSIREVSDRIMLSQPAHPSVVNNSLRREMDVVTSTALAKDPERRYQSVRDLAQDVERYLNHEPLAATSPGLWQQLRLLTARHRTAVRTAVLGLLLLVLGLAGTAWGWYEAHLAQVSESTQREKAEDAADDLRDASVHLYAGLLEGARSAIEDQRTATAQRLLDSTDQSLRGIEWRFLRSQVDDSIATWPSHNNGVRGMDVDAAGTTMISCGLDKVVRLRNLDTNESRILFSEASAVPLGVVIRADAGRGVVALGNKSLRVFDPNDLAVSRTLQLADVPVSLAWLDEPRTVIGLTEDGRIFVADVEANTVALYRVEDEGNRNAHEITVDAERNVAIVAFDDATIRSWRLDGEAAVSGTIARDRSGVSALAAGPDGNVLAIGFDDGRIEMFDRIAQRSLCVLHGHSHVISDLAFVGDNQLLSGSRDGLIRSWDLPSQTINRTWRGHSGSIVKIAAATGRDTFLTGGADGSIRTWSTSDAGNPAVLRADQASRTHENLVASVDFSSNGERMATLALAGQLILWDAAGGNRHLLATHSFDKQSRLVRFSPDGNVIAVALDDGSIIFLTAPELQVQRQLQGPNDLIRSLRFSADGTQLFVLSFDGSLRSWQVADGAARVLIPAAEGATPAVRAFAVSNDARTLYVGDHAGVVSSNNIADGTRRTLFNAQPTIDAIERSSDGTLLAVAHSDPAGIIVYNVAEGREVSHLRADVSRLMDIRFADGNTRLLGAGVDGNLRIWDAQRGVELLIVGGHADAMLALDVAGDSSAVLTGGADGNAVYWSTQTAKERHAAQPPAQTD